MINRNYATMTYPAVVPVLDADDKIVDDLLVYKRGDKLKLEDFVNRVIGLKNTSGLIYPPGCRLYHSSKTATVLVIEEAPRMRTITVDLPFDGIIAKLNATGKLEEYGFQSFLEQQPDPPYELSLYFPWVVYVITLNNIGDWISIRPFLRLQPITGYSDYLLQCPLPNIGANSILCTGDKINNEDEEEEPDHIGLQGQVTDAIERFWFNRFNSDYISQYNQYRDIPFVSDFLTWMYNSHKDPMFIHEVKWIPFKLSLGELVDSLCVDQSQTEYAFQQLSSIFRRDENMPMNDDVRYKRNITETLYISDEYMLSVGEKVKINKEIYYVYAFIGIPGDEPEFIECEDENGSVHRFNVTDDLIEEIRKYLERDTKLYKIIINEIEIKRGDILKLEFPFETFKKVDEIIKFKDGNIEIKSGQDYYLMESIRFSKFDGNLTCQGNDLEEEKKYLMVELSLESNYGYIRTMKPVRYRGPSFDSGQLTAKFTSMESTHEYFIKPGEEDTTCKIINIDEIESPILLRIFNSLIYNKEYDNGSKKYYIKDQIYQTGLIARSYPNDVDEILKNIMDDDMTELFIPSADIDIQFRIGDKVVHCNWDNPLSMNIILTITGFYVEMFENKNMLYIMTKDGNDKIVRIPYIDLSNGIINIGKVRSIALEYNGWRTGDKIKASETKIQNFPKKDTNIIIGFLNDTGTKYPLMLCSNHCTQWMHEDVMSKFHHYKKGSPQWIKNKATYNKDMKYKIQSGDLLVNKWGDLYVAFYKCNYGEGPYNVTTRLRLGRVSKRDFSIIDEWACNRSSEPNGYKKYGILTPRYNRNAQDMMTPIRAIPNLHGGFTIDRRIKQGYREVLDYV
jgi:hypothetical protein